MARQFMKDDYTAVLDALGLDHDHTLAVNVTPEFIHVSSAELDDTGKPVVTGGVLQRVETMHSLTD